jgi:hypothetical protein
MPTSPVECPHCGYSLATFAETVEALEGEGKCLLCGGEMNLKDLEAAVDKFSTKEIKDEGKERAEAEAEIAEEEELLDSSPDFGDEGEDEEDPIF